ncbi:hypothetical protein DSO57_1009817 [Entomophthora muscae]|uniref:Uncharacterized protein n=1 Tax=Entomophthora muscae TaxID=34485 RepID=A0ACC2RXU4_9FUNG|nr:hypothetical protein DSO57_1009817 [Entomophthora muscae]
MILESGAYSNIISLPFLKLLPQEWVAPSDTVFIMAYDWESYSMNTAVHLSLCLGGIKMSIDAAIFNHKQYTLLIGCNLMSNFGVTTREQLASVVNKFITNIVEDSDDLPEASEFEHEIDTGDAYHIAFQFHQLPL